MMEKKNKMKNMKIILLVFIVFTLLIQPFAYSGGEGLGVTNPKGNVILLPEDYRIKGGLLSIIGNIFAIWDLKTSYKPGETITVQVEEWLTDRCPGYLYVVFEVYNKPKDQQTKTSYVGGDSFLVFRDPNQGVVGRNYRAVLDYYIPANAQGTWSVSGYLYCDGRTENAREYSTVTESNFQVGSVPPGCVPNWRWESWSQCDATGLQCRAGQDLNNCPGSETKSECRPCTIICQESWNCEEWKCVNNVETRICIDSNKCGTYKDRPSIRRDCVSDVIIPTTEYICCSIIPGYFKSEWKTKEEGCPFGKAQVVDTICTEKVSPKPEEGIPGEEIIGEKPGLTYANLETITTSQARESGCNRNDECESNRCEDLDYLDDNILKGIKDKVKKWYWWDKDGLCIKKEEFKETKGFCDFMSGLPHFSLTDDDCTDASIIWIGGLVILLLLFSRK